MKKQTFTLIILLTTASFVLFGQCPPAGFPQPANNCQGAPVLCDNLDIYCTTINNSNVTQPFPGCANNVLNNDEWFAFFAGSTTIEIQIVPSNCLPGTGQNNFGLQGGIYQGCGGTVMDVQCPCTTNPFSLFSTNFIVGEIYWIVLDGCAGSVCDFDVNVLQGSTVPFAPDDPGPISGDTDLCQGESVVLSIPPAFGATIYNWNMTPSIGSINANDNTVTITGNTLGTAQLCVDVANECQSNPIQSCINISVNPDVTVSFTETVCEGDCFTVGGTQYCNTGSFQQTLQTFAGCDSVVMLNLTVIDVNPVVPVPPRVDCNNTSVTLDASGSTPSGVTFNWTTTNGVITGSPTSPTIDVDQPGTYTVEVTSTQNGVTCTETLDIEVLKDDTPPTVNVQPPGSIDCINMTIMLDGSGSSSGGIYTYNWTGPGVASGGGSATPTVNAGGNYTLVVTNTENGCTAEQTVNVMEDLTPPIVMIAPPIELTCTFMSVQLDGTGSSTGPTFTYQWTGGQITAGSNSLTPTVGAPGSYTLTVTNTTNGCTEEQTVNVTQNITPPPAMIQPPPPLDCSNQTTGVTVDATGSAGGNNTFVWTAQGGNITNGINTLTPTVDGPGTYTITVTNPDNGCTAEASTVVMQDLTPPAVSAGPDLVLDCNNATLSIGGSAQGSGGVTITWTTNDGNIISGGNTANPNIDQAGTYTITVTNGSNGCTAEDMVTITENMIPPIAVNQPPGEITCTTQTINIDGTGSSVGPTITYNWTGPGIVGGGATLTPTVNGGGTYTLTVTDQSNGCTAEVMVNVPENTMPPPVMIQPPGQLDCSNQTTGMTLDGTGSGNANSTFQWTGGTILSGASTLTPTIANPGTYTLTVTDQANGCTAAQTVSVTADFTPPIVNAGPDQVLNCNNPTQISVNGTGSSSGPNFNITWTTTNGNILAGANTLTPAVNMPGLYTLTIVNSTNGCSATDVVLVTEDFATPMVNINPTGEINCFTPTIQLSGAGSSTEPGLNIIWQGPGIVSGGSTLTPTINTGGLYTLSITNPSNGCFATTDILVNENMDTPNAVIVPPQQLDCINIVIPLDASASTNDPNVTFQWTGGSFQTGTNTLTPIVNGPGTYTLTMTNNLSGCTAMTSVTVTQDAAPPTAEAGPDLMIDCTSITQTINGNSSSSGPGIIYNWSGPGILNGSNSTSPTVNAGGLYMVTVTNTNNGCTAVDFVTVVEDNIPPITLISPPEFLTCQSGTVTLDGTPSQFEPGWIITWVTIGGNFVSGQNTLTPQVDQPGTYTLILSNPFNGCSSNFTVAVSGDIDAPTAEIAPADLIDCLNEDVTLDASNSSGNGAVSYEWTTNDGNIISGAFTTNPTINAPGTYTFVITNDNNGCTDTAEITVEESMDEPTADAGPDETIGCASPNVNLDGTGSSSNGNFSYTWTNENGNTVSTGTLTPSVGSAGIYTLTVINEDNGCTSTDEVEITQDTDLPIISVEAVDILDCVNNIVLIDASNSDQGGDLTFEWTTSDGSFASGEFTLTPEVDAPGTYTLTISNALSGCASSENVVVDENMIPPDISLLTPSLLNCVNTEISLNASSSVNTNNLTIEWTTSNGNIVNGENTLTPNVDQAGTYTLTLTNLNNGCVNTENIIVDANNDAPVANAGADLTIGCAEPSVELNGSQSSTGNEFTYQWQNENGITISDTLILSTSAPGTYTLTVTNNLSQCTTADEVTVSQDTNVPTIELAPAEALTCTQNTVILDATGSDEGTEFTIEWTTNNGSIVGNADELTINVDSAGTYNLVITNTQSGCSATQSITVDEDNIPPTAAILSPDSLDCVTTSLILNGATSGSNEDFIFEWSTPNGNFAGNTDSLLVEIDMIGTYTLLLTNSNNGCTQSASVTVEESLDTPTADAGADLIIACDVPSVELNGSGSSTGAQFSYEWVDENGVTLAENTLNPSTSAPGTYTLIVTNTTNQCTSFDEITVDQDINVPTIEIATPEPLTCATGLIALDATGSDSGTGLTIEWTTVDGNLIGNSDELTTQADAPGTYNLLIINTSSGCSATQSIVVVEDLENPMAEILSPVMLNCAVENTVLNAENSGANADFSFEWITLNGNFSSPTDSLIVEIDAPGTYNLLITNTANGCTADAAVTVDQDITDPVANAGADLTILCTQPTVSLDGSQSSTGTNFSYQWQNANGTTIAQDTLNPSIGAAGTFILVVTNTENGCVATDEVTVEQDANAPEIDIAPPGMLTCANNEILVDATASDQGGNLTFEWNTTDGNIVSGTNDLMLTVDAVGTYALTIANTINGCSSTQNVIVNEDLTTPNPQIEPALVLSCTQTNGNLDATASGNSDDFNILWTTSNGSILSGDTTLTPQIAAAGIYTLTLTNLSNGCAESADIEVTQDGNPPFANAGNDAEISCDVEELQLDGSSSGGIGQIELLWETQDGNILNGASSTTPTINAAGTYTLTVTNLDNGCVAVDEAVVLPNVDQPEIFIASPATLTCTDTTVSIDASNSSVGANFNIQWTTSNGNILNGDTTLSPTVDAAGTYILTILNTQNGCESSQPIAVEQNVSALDVTIDTPTELDCEVLEVTLSAQNNSGLTLNFEWTTLDGNIVSGENTETPLVNEPGVYTLLVTNSDNGCTGSTAIEVLQNAIPPIADAGSPVEVSCTEPTASLNGGQSSTGNEFTYLWTSVDGNIVSGETTLTPVVDAGGTYILVVTNQNNGCTAESNTLVEQDSALPTATIATPSLITCTEMTAVLEATVTGDLSLFNLEWTTTNGTIISGATSLTPTVSSAGTYILTIENTSSADCIVTEMVTVEADLDNPIPNIEAAETLTCTVLEIDLNAQNSVTQDGFSATWTTPNGTILSGNNTLTPTVNAPGTYTLLLTNANGCTASLPIEVPQNITPPIAQATGGLLTCTTTSLQLNGTGSDTGTEFQYLWTTTNGNIVSGATNLDPLIDAPGTYNLLIINNINECETSTIVMTPQDIAEPTATASTPVEIDCTTEQANLDGSNSTGSAGLQFTWTGGQGSIVEGQNSPTPTVSGTGMYQLVVTNEFNGCTAETEVEVIRNLPVGNPISESPVCLGEMGSIYIENSMNGNPPYEYSFDGGVTYHTKPLLALPAGSYEIHIRDTKGCEHIETVGIPDGLDATLAVEPVVELQLGDSYQINTQINFPETELESVLWTPAAGLDCDTCLHPVATPTEHRIYELRVQTHGGCAAQALVQFFLDSRPQIYVPNAFSPNGDGENDRFMIFAKDNSVREIRQFMAFNRWGESMFNFTNFPPNNPEFGWDGLHRGEPMNPAVYVWFAEIEFEDGRVEVFKGDFVLVR